MNAAKRRAAIALALATSLAAAGAARAWEAQTTHAGLAEVAAQASVLHQRLVALGFAHGLFEPLTIPPADAPALTDALRLLPPSTGAQPDDRGQQSAMGWLVAGAILADLVPAQAADHYYDPSTAGGFAAPSLGLVGSLHATLRERFGRAALPDHGMPAPDWIAAKDNPFGLTGFSDQLQKAVRAATPGERSRAMAGALVAAGAILHVLADMGSPAHVRGDVRADLDPLGPGPDDLGSRFEHLAALAYGRLGVPAPGRVVTRTSARAFFTSPEHGGLADETAARFFSAYTLPGAMAIDAGDAAQAHLARPLPALPARLNLMQATQPGGTTLHDASGACLARYQVERGTARFWLDDDCMLDEIRALLPEVASFEAGLLDFLFRGTLQVALAGPSATVTSADSLGTGTIELLAEDGHGVRTSLGATSLGGTVSFPEGTARVIAMFVGADASGEQVVAIGAADVP